MENKMSKKFNIYYQIAMFIEALVIATTIGCIIIIAVEIINNIQNIEQAKINILEFFKYDYSESEIFFCITGILKLTSIIIITDCVRKMFYESFKENTPFLKKNVKRINIISICSIIFFAKSIIGILLILSLGEILKYGLKLQIESDETL